MRPLDGQAERLCDAFLAGELPEEQRWSFDRQLMRDPELAAAVDLQQQVSDSVRREFAVPDLERLVAEVSDAARARAATRPERVELQGSQLRGSRLRGLWLLLVTTLLLGLATWATGDRWLGSDTTSEVMRPWQSELGQVVALSVAGAATLAGSARLLQHRRGQLQRDQAPASTVGFGFEPPTAMAFG